MSEFYIPPNGIYFRLLGYVSQYVLYSRYEDPQVGQVSRDRLYEDQYFTLIHGTGAREGTYAIKSLRTGNVLFSRNPEQPHIGNVSGDGEYNDNWFKLEVGTGKYAQQFRLVTPFRVYSDQYFSFLWEDLEVKRVEYDLDLGQIVSSTPLVIANQTQTNYSSHDQEMSFELDETVTHISTFEYSLGLNITFGTTFKAGVPIVAEAEFSIDFQINNQFTWGQTTEFSESYRATFPVHADQGRPCGQCLR
ncbi:hemolytic lectin [Phlebopus sp. FC_14]|nr:hemolytic lectin [Phlebopus sp. FC_14]